MRLSEKAKQQVRPKDFWLSVGAAIVLLSIICVYSGPLQHSPAVRWVLAIVLLGVWSVHLRILFQVGLRAYSWTDAVTLLGVTFIFGCELWPHAPAIVSKVGDNGIFLILIGNLAPYFTSRKRPKGGTNTG